MRNPEIGHTTSKLSKLSAQPTQIDHAEHAGAGNSVRASRWRPELCTPPPCFTLKIAKKQHFEAPGGRTVVLGGIERPLQKWGILRISDTNEDCPECIQLQHG